MKKNSIKNTRINSEVLKELSVLIRDELKDPRVSPMTSVTDVDVTPDLQYCRVYISVLGDEAALKDTLLGLRAAGGFLRRALAQTVNLRHTPELQFLPDHSLEYGAKMDALIREVSRRDQEAQKNRPPEPEEPAENTEGV